MKIAWLLHLHQPPTQFPFIIREISNSCYRPLVALLTDNSSLKMTFSISGSLIEWWEKEGCTDIIDGIRYLVGRGQIELVGTGCYHPILTLVTEEEVVRQIELEESILKRCFGMTAAPLRLKGFFPPEMAVSDNLLAILSRLGYSYCAADEVASLGERHRYLSVLGHLTKVAVRDRGASLAVAFGFVQTLNGFENMVDNYSRFTDSLFLAMDGETFGHHWPGSLQFLKELVAFGHEEYLTASEFLAQRQPVPVQQIAESTWGTSDEDLHRGILYPKWRLRDNTVHQLQWQLTDLAISVVEASGESAAARALLDRALHSDQYWWASHNPFWNLEMIKRGADLLLEAIRVADPKLTALPKAEKFYANILSEAKQLYGEAVITG